MTEALPETDTATRAVEPNELVRRALAGCADSFNELAQYFRPRLLSLLRVRLATQNEDAEDVVQETLARAYLRLQQYRPEFRFSTWLYTIALRLAYDHMRQQRRQPRRQDFRQIEATAVVDESQAALIERDVVDNLWAVAKNRLSGNQYTALWLRYSEDMTVDEIACAMQRSRIGVRVLLHRARGTLSAHFHQASRNSAGTEANVSTSVSTRREPTA